MANFMRAVLPRLATYSLTYVALQVITGIEVAVAALALVYTLGWTLPVALSFTTVAGFPLLLLQGAVAVAFHERRLKRRPQGHCSSADALPSPSAQVHAHAAPASTSSNATSTSIAGSQ